MKQIDILQEVQLSLIKFNKIIYHYVAISTSNVSFLISMSNLIPQSSVAIVLLRQLTVTKFFTAQT